MGLTPRSGRYPGGRNGNPFQCSRLESPMDREAWQGAGFETMGFQRVGHDWVTEHTDLLLMLQILKPCIYTKTGLCDWLQSLIFCSSWFRSLPVPSARALGPFLYLINVDTRNHSGKMKVIREAQDACFSQLNACGASNLLTEEVCWFNSVFHSIILWVLSCYHMTLQLCHIQWCHRCINNWLELGD